MKVTYLAHSGFLVETEKAYYLFDYIKGVLAEFSGDKPIYVFASHWHNDHFSEMIFDLYNNARDIHFILSEDIFAHNKNKATEWIENYGDRITTVLPGLKYEIDGIKIKTLLSTDEGVAFIVKEEGGKSIYHAGDLNWWHWEGEPDPWNPDMEIAYKNEIDSIQENHFDVAFVPLDPRLEDAYWYGLGYFEKMVRADHIFPMHFWGKYDIIDKYLREYHKSSDKLMIHTIKQEGEEYEL